LSLSLRALRLITLYQLNQVYEDESPAASVKIKKALLDFNSSLLSRKHTQSIARKSC
jgi:hypothetical protein